MGFVLCVRLMFLDVVLNVICMFVNNTLLFQPMQFPLLITYCPRICRVRLCHVTGVANQAMASEYVLQGLRTIVNNRNQQQQIGGIRPSPSPMTGIMSGGSMTILNNQQQQHNPQQQQQLTGGGSASLMNTVGSGGADQSMSFNFDITPNGKCEVGDNRWLVTKPVTDSFTCIYFFPSYWCASTSCPFCSSFFDCPWQTTTIAAGSFMTTWVESVNRWNVATSLGCRTATMASRLG